MQPGKNCTLCKKAILGAPKAVGTSYFHQACFKCSQCSVQLQVQTHKVYKGSLLCDHCVKVNMRSVTDSAGLVGGGLAPPPAVEQRPPDAAE